MGPTVPDPSTVTGLGNSTTELEVEVGRKSEVEIGGGLRVEPGLEIEEENCEAVLIVETVTGVVVPVLVTEEKA